MQLARRVFSHSHPPALDRLVEEDLRVRCAVIERMFTR
jgi:hypothetical protein